MHIFTEKEDAAIKLLSELTENDDDMVSGDQLWEYFEHDAKRGSGVIKLLIAHGYLAEASKFFGDGTDRPSWVMAIYSLTPRGYAALNEYQRGDHPFKISNSSSHHGDIYHTRVEGNSGAFAVGNQATANFNAGIRTEELAQIFKQMQEIVRQLPIADKDDGEHQLSKLAEAIQEGPQAVQERKSSFVRFVNGLRESANAVEASTTIYKLAVPLFSHFGVELPNLHNGA